MRMKEAGLVWPLPADLDDAALEALLFTSEACQAPTFPQPDWAEVDRQMHSGKGATVQVLHEEYLQQFPDGMKYRRFCQLYKRFCRSQKSTMRFVYDAGSVAFVDYAGRTVPIGPSGGAEEFRAQIFVGVLGASGYVYADATRSQQIPDWLGSHQRMYASWGGVPRTVVCDNLKSAVSKTSYRGEPQIQENYRDQATHYGINIVPARPRRPKDKGKAEQAVQMVTRTVLFVLRNETFATLHDLNLAIIELIARLNSKLIKRLKISREQLFESIERPALRSLPTTAWEYAEYSHLRVGTDYHVEFRNHAYSVPYGLIGEQVEVRATTGIVDICHKGTHVASHARSYISGRSTCAEHRDPSHAAYQDWRPEDALQNAKLIGPSCCEMLQKIYAQDPHTDHQRRAAQSLNNMAREYSPLRLEIACTRALAADAHDLTFIRNLLRNHREAIQRTGTDDTGAIKVHSNLRSEEEFTLHIVSGGNK